MPSTMKKILQIIAPILLLSACAQQQLTTADKDHARLAYAKAAKGYEKALTTIDDRDAALRAADSYQRMNMAAKAAEWYAVAEKQAPLSADDALRYGQVLQSLDRTPEALAQFERVLAERRPPRQPGDGVGDRGRRDTRATVASTSLASSGCPPLTSETFLSISSTS